MTKKNSLPEQNTSTEPRQTVIALARGLEILQCFSIARPQLGTAEIARMTGLPQPTVWRLCQTLVQSGFLLPSVNGQRLQLGMAALSLGLSASATFDSLEIVRPRMQAIADHYGSAVSIAACERLQMVYLERRAAETTLATNLQRGSRLAIHRCTLGWAYLAALESRPRALLLARLKKEHPQDAELLDRLAKETLEQYKEDGFVLQHGLVHRGIVALAIPIIPKSDKAQPLAINISGDVANISEAVLRQEIAPQLRALADILEAHLLHAD